jgi:hypothetical protein
VSIDPEDVVPRVEGDDEEDTEEKVFVSTVDGRGGSKYDCCRGLIVDGPLAADDAIRPLISMEDAVDNDDGLSSVI